MGLTINNPEVDALAQELSEYTGESLTEVVINSLRERLQREKERGRQPGSLKEKLLQIGRECASYELLDPRSPDEVIGYNSYGVPE